MDAQTIIDALLDSKRKGRVSNELAEFYREVIEQELWKFQELKKHSPTHDDLVQDIMVRVIGKFRVALSKKQMRVRGYNPTQIIKFLRGQVTFSLLEHRQSIFDRKTKLIKRKEVEIVYMESTKLPHFASS